MSISKFARFMKENKAQRQNEEYAPTKSMTDENGEPLKWTFRHITSKENDALRDECTTDVQVTGKINMFRPKVNTSKYIAKMIVASTVFPDLYDSELQDSYGVSSPEDLLYAMVDDIGEYQDLSLWVQQFQGFTEPFEELKDEAKN